MLPPTEERMLESSARQTVFLSPGMQPVLSLSASARPDALNSEPASAKTLVHLAAGLAPRVHAPSKLGRKQPPELALTPASSRDYAEYVNLDDISDKVDRGQSPKEEHTH